MTSRLALRSLSSKIVCLGVLAGAVFSCSRDPVVAPRGLAGDAVPLMGKSPTALAVTSTNPSFGDQGATIDVHILGSGFTSGAQATWLLHGAADPAHVRTNSTTFVSSTELVANITIASDAQLDFWDVQVALIGGKNGVGSECFEVTSAQILGPGTLGSNITVRVINEQLQVVGWSGSTSGSIPWIFDDALGMVNLGSGEAHGLDPLGAVVVGRNPTFAGTWTRQPDNSWLSAVLPQASGVVGGNAMAAARTADGTLVVVGWDEVPGARKSSANLTRPAGWRLTTAGWSAPQFYTIPTGSTTATARDVNRLEMVVGQLDGSDAGAVWEGPTSYTRLDGTPNRINPSGTVIVGHRNNSPVYWWRDPATHAWHTTGVPLPTIVGSSCTSGMGRDVNDAGVIVGVSCGPNKNQATVWLLDFSGATPVLVGTPTPLPGLGIKNTASADLSSAASVTESTPYIVTGATVYTNPTRVAVRWRLR
jgi:hypothetical protein